MPRRSFKPLVLAAPIGTPAGVFAQDRPPTSDTLFKDFASRRSPGCAVGAATSLATKADGMADLEHDVPPLQGPVP